MSVERTKNGGGHCLVCDAHTFPYEARCSTCRRDAELALEAARTTLANARKRDPGLGYEPRWRDASTDAWGARSRGLARQWVGGNCLASCIGSMLNASIDSVPDPQLVEYRKSRDWLGPYNQRLAKALNYKLEPLPLSLLPPRGRGQWIAGLQLEDEAHAVVAREWYCIHDPAGLIVGQLPAKQLISGFVLKPTRRVVPVLRSHGQGGRMVVAA
jgi:hypothetical protein